MSSISKEDLLSSRQQVLETIRGLEAELAKARQELNAFEQLLSVRYGWAEPTKENPTADLLNVAALERIAKEEWLTQISIGQELTTSDFSSWLRERHPSLEVNGTFRNLMGLTFKKLMEESLIDHIREGKGRIPALYKKACKT
jgi:hypothetical protein